MANNAEDLEAQGLIANSYDALFSVRKRIRMINDLALPTRQGLATNQIGVGILAFILAVVTYGLVLVPILGLLGIARDPRLMIAWLFIPPVLAAQRIAKPMAYGKSIGGSFTSFLRFHLDDPIHRRGIPIPTPRQPDDRAVLHYQREWVPAAEVTPLMRGEGDFTDVATERRFAMATASVSGGQPLELQEWYDARARAHLDKESEERRVAAAKDEQTVQFRRGSSAKVLVPTHDDTENPEGE
jgi:hypothetical protein